MLAPSRPVIILGGGFKRDALPVCALKSIQLQNTTGIARAQADPRFAFAALVSPKVK